MAFVDSVMTPTLCSIPSSIIFDDADAHKEFHLSLGNILAPGAFTKHHGLGAPTRSLRRGSEVNLL